MTAASQQHLHVNTPAFGQHRESLLYLQPFICPTELKKWQASLLSFEELTSVWIILWTERVPDTCPVLSKNNGAWHKNKEIHISTDTSFTNIFSSDFQGFWSLWMWRTDRRNSFFQAIRLSLEQALPSEPSEEAGEQISKLRIRTPSGQFLERRFLGSCKLQVLFDFVASKGYPFDEFKLLTTFPRRNVSDIPFLFNTRAHNPMHRVIKPF